MYHSYIFKHLLIGLSGTTYKNLRECTHTHKIQDYNCQGLFLGTQQCWQQANTKYTVKKNWQCDLMFLFIDSCSEFRCLASGLWISFLFSFEFRDSDYKWLEYRRLRYNLCLQEGYNLIVGVRQIQKNKITPEMLLSIGLGEVS